MQEQVDDPMLRRPPRRVSSVEAEVAVATGDLVALEKRLVRT
jgi:hypothetical protein